jgi:hypothetical protein
VSNVGLDSQLGFTTVGKGTSAAHSPRTFEEGVLQNDIESILWHQRELFPQQLSSLVEKFGVTGFGGGGSRLFSFFGQG